MTTNQPAPVGPATPPAEGEVGELVRIPRDVSGDYDDDSYPLSLESQQILRAAELLQEQAAELATLRSQQLAPPAGHIPDVTKMAAALLRLAPKNPLGAARLMISAAALLEQQSAELAKCHEALRRIRVQQRIPGGGW